MNAQEVKTQFQSMIEHTLHSIRSTSTGTALLEGRVIATRTPAQGEVRDTAYLDFLMQHYGFIRQTEPTLLQTGQSLLESSHYSSLGQSMLEHASEEHAHEQDILTDVQNGGYDLERVKAAYAQDPLTEGYNARANMRSQDPQAAQYTLAEATILEGVATEIATGMSTNLPNNSDHPQIDQMITFLVTHAEADVGTDDKAGHLDENFAKLQIVQPQHYEGLLREGDRVATFYRGLWEGIHLRALHEQDYGPLRYSFLTRES